MHEIVKGRFAVCSSCSIVGLCWWADVSSTRVCLRRFPALVPVGACLPNFPSLRSHVLETYVSLCPWSAEKALEIVVSVPRPWS